MGRPPRITKPGLVCHVLNRRVMGLPLFQKDGDYLAFERVWAESLERPDAPDLLAWTPVSSCLMPNHWPVLTRQQLGGSNLPADRPFGGGRFRARLFR